MNKVLVEKDYQKEILNYLEKHNGFCVRNSSDYNKDFACDETLLFSFLKHTQEQELKELSKFYTQKEILKAINEAIMKRSLLDVLKNGLEIDGISLKLLYTKSAFNDENNAKYEKNIFSVMEEVWISERERIDIVIFLNGLAIMSFELKCNAAAQDYKDAIEQYRFKRDAKNRLFLFKAGVLVSFAMDLEQVYMTTKLNGKDSAFLPFNMGNGVGISAGAGNPLFKDKKSISYMWEDVLKKDSIIELITQFIFIDKKDNIIFPRYHQRDVICKILKSVYHNGASKNYLIQHSAGSGKTNSIAWLAYRLSSWYCADKRNAFDSVIVITDRLVVDRQLQDAIKSMEHQEGYIKVLDESCSSKDLANALKGKTKIIATTIQKFPYIVNEVQNLKDKRFALIIDEAHSSTAGKNMGAVTEALASGNKDKENLTPEELINDELKRHGKQENIAMFAFTATPKPETLQLFGNTNKDGQKEAFHTYSMKQAIQEGFILNVLQNYITYNTYCKINKSISEDPKYNVKDAKAKIKKFINSHEINIKQRVEIIIEHFREHVIYELSGKAKAMVVTDSRESAIKYKNAFDGYIKQMGYKDINALVAFSGEVTLEGEHYTEFSINNIAEDKLPAEFNTDKYNFLIVANKYQTGFDQPKLCAMYIAKSLSGINAVQTLSRLNRVCPPYEKKTFILDFANSFNDIKEAFSHYYTITLLPESPISYKDKIYEVESKINYIFNDTQNANELLYKSKRSEAEQNSLEYMFNKTKSDINVLKDENKKELIKYIKDFIRIYEALMQITNFKNLELHKKYRFISCLLMYLDSKSEVSKDDLENKITATNFIQEKSGGSIEPITTNPEIENTLGGGSKPSENKFDRLSNIISEINAKTGQIYDIKRTAEAIFQVKDIMINSDKLKTMAQNNTEKNFEIGYFNDIGDILVEKAETDAQNKDFFYLLLKDESYKKQVFGIFRSEVYNHLRSH